MEMYFKQQAEHFLSSEAPLQAFRPFPQACEREKYQALPAGLRQKLIAMGENCLGFPYPPIRATDFMAFQRNGNRTDYEDLYFKRRHALNSLVVAECMEGCGRFLDDIINGVWALCEESGWQLPAHDSSVLPDSARPILDLFACETGAQLACIHYLLGMELDKACPHVTKRIRSELERRIFIPYMQEHFWWMGKDDEPMCNWTPWCTQNILYSAFLCSNSHIVPSCLKEKGILKKAAESCDYFLKDYGADGCCDEGAQYYRHAGLCLHGAMRVLNQVTGNAFLPLLSSDKIRNMAAYIFNVHVEDQYYFNFSDCSPIAGRAGVREYLFGKDTGQPELMQFAAEDFRAAGDDNLFSDESHRLNLFYRLQAVFCYEEITAFDLGVQPVHRDIYYPSVGLFLVRSSVFSLAVKAGGNGDSHNHNDTGSITLYRGGRPVLVDIGVESYTKKTFSPQRYEVWTMQSGYHNLPAIEGFDQHEGASYRARDVVVHMADAEQESAASKTPAPFISMELAGAYPLAEAGRPEISYVRKVAFDRARDCITLTDSTNAGNVILNFITYDRPMVLETPTALKDTAAASQGAPPARCRKNALTIGGTYIDFRGGELIEIETLPITDKRLQAAWDHDLYRFRLKMTDNTFVMQIHADPSSDFCHRQGSGTEYDPIENKTPAKAGGKAQI